MSLKIQSSHFRGMRVRQSASWFLVSQRNWALWCKLAQFWENNMNSIEHMIMTFWYTDNGARWSFAKNQYLTTYWHSYVMKVNRNLLGIRIEFHNIQKSIPRYWCFWKPRRGPILQRDRIQNFDYLYVYMYLYVTSFK